MLVLRCTARALGLIGVGPASLGSTPPTEDDWYLNLLWIERRKCLLFTHAGTLFPFFVAGVRKGDLRPLGPYVVRLIHEELRAEGLQLDALGHLEAASVQVERTASKSILAYMRDMAIHARYRIEAMGGLERADVVFLNRYLRRSLHNRDGFITPLDLVGERLGRKEWSSS